MRVRFALFWRRHRSLLWALHSVWALATGVAVIWLARERYGFVKWVVLFLVLTWVSTLFFGRRTVPREDDTGHRTPGLAEEVSSYLTRTLFQETLFFLIPFYAYSTVIRSPNVLFMVLLGGLAILSCLDLVFDRLLRSSAVFGTLFFGTVAFAALNLLLPLLLSIRPIHSLRISAVLAAASAVPIALRAAGRSRGRFVGTMVTVAIATGGAMVWPAVVPAVPLRLDSAIFATDVDGATLEPVRTLEDGVPAGDVSPRVAIVARVFAPGSIPASVQLVWYRDGDLVRTSRPIEITAHDGGFRVWDGMPASAGPVEPGRWRVVLRSVAGSIFGVATLDVAPDPS